MAGEVVHKFRRIESKIEGVVIIEGPRFGDERGDFAETFHKEAFAELGIDVEFVQDNHVRTARSGTVRGLHWQSAPHAQAKLVRVMRGRIIDVAVDLRPGSPTLGQHQRVELRAQNNRQIFVPAGFAHGYATLEADTEVSYKVSAYYAPDAEGGIRFDDGELGIDWGVPHESAQVSAKDRALPSYAEVRAQLRAG